MEKIKREFFGIVDELLDGSFKAKIYTLNTKELVQINIFKNSVVNEEERNLIFIDSTFFWEYGENDGGVYFNIKFNERPILSEEEKIKRKIEIDKKVEDMLTIFK